jgi:Fe-S-cluster containining protein
MAAENTLNRIPCRGGLGDLSLEILMTERSTDKETDDPDLADIPPEQREKILSLMEKMMEMGICAVYGQEEEGLPDAIVPCEANIRSCKARCCTLQFALTREEVEKKLFKHNPSRPFFIARDRDGYCPHLDRGTLQCTVWSQRPLRCRRYDCSRVDEPS